MRHPLFTTEETFTLRPYQDDAVEGLRSSIRHGNKRVLLQAGTGSGKTIIASQIMLNADSMGKRVLFLAHRRKLIDQCSEKLSRFGVRHGVIMAGRPMNRGYNVQVASVQTLWSRAVQSEMMEFPYGIDLIVIDECHRTMSKMYLKLIERFPDAAVLGLTATPIRGDGRGLGEVYQDMVRCPHVGELTRQGYLVPVRYFAPEEWDVSSVDVRGGDYVESQLEGAVDRDELIGNVVETWGRLGEDRRTVVFAAGISHSMHIAERFERAGVASAHIDGDTPDDERERVFRAVREDEIKVVSNAMVLTEGWDEPCVSCEIIARPTKSLGLYVQIAGRILRPHPGKKDALLIDHTGAVMRHGFVDEEFPWSLDGNSSIQDRLKERRKREPKPVTCPECKTVFKSKAKCPACGWEPQRKPEAVPEREGNIVEIDRRKRAGKLEYTPQQRASWIRQLAHIQRERGYKPGWAAHQYKKKFGRWPPNGWQNWAPKVPTAEVMGYVQSRLIAYAKAKKKERRA